MLEFTVKDEDGKRLDDFLTAKLQENFDTSYSRSKVQKLILDKKVFVDDNIVTKKNYRIKRESKIEIDITFNEDENPEEKGRVKKKYIENSRKKLYEAQNIPLDILYEDDDILVLNKDRGILVHPTDKDNRDTLINALLYHLGDNLPLGSSDEKNYRPGIIHRLDKNTSGLIVIAKTDKAYEELRKDFDSHNIKRKYIALAKGNFKEQNFIIDNYLGRRNDGTTRRKVFEKKDFENLKRAITKVKVLKQYREFDLLELELETGRTHQIRVHLSHLNHSVLGDELYGGKANKYGKKGQYLHAFLLGFRHPVTKEYLEFETEIPDYFKRLIGSEEVK